MIELNHKKILVTYLMYFGDLVTVTPFLEILRRQAPDSHITLLVDEKLKDVVRYNPYVDRVETIDKKGKDNSVFGLWRVGKRLRDEKFDITMNLHGNERTSLLCLLSKPKCLTGTTAPVFRWFWDRYTPIDYRLHNAERYIDVLSQLGYTDKRNEGLQIVTSPLWEKKAQDFYEEEGIREDDRVIGFHVGSAVPRKCWSPKNFAKVADCLAKRGCKVVIFGGGTDENRVRETVSYMQTRPVIATGRFSIGELVAAMKRCDLFISNDSGPMHAAASQKRKIVGLFSSGNPTTFGPYGTDSICIKGTKVYDFVQKPITFEESSEFVSPEEISVESVIEAAEKLLALEKEMEG